MGEDKFQRYAAQRFSDSDFELLTEEEETLLRKRRRHGPQSVAMQMHMAVETVYRRQRSIRSKLG